MELVLKLVRRPPPRAATAVPRPVWSGWGGLPQVWRTFRAMLGARRIRARGEDVAALLAGIHAQDPFRGRPIYRTELWDVPGGGRAALLFVAAYGACAVVGVRAQPSGRGLDAVQGVFTEGAILSDRDAVLAALPARPSNAAFLAMLGTFADGPDWFLESSRGLAETLLRLTDAFTDPDGARPGQRWMGTPLDVDVDARTGHPYVTSDRHIADVCYFGTVPMAPPRKPAEDPALVRDDGTGSRTRPCDAVAADLSAWHAGLVALCRPCALPQAAWTQATFAFLSAAGETGIRRRQAGDLQPAFLAMLPMLPDVVSAIDAGRPFEALLAERANARLGFPPGRGLDMARMRRLRAYPAMPSGAPLDQYGQPKPAPDGFSAVAWVAARFPIEAVPKSPEGWARIVPHVSEAIWFAKEWDLDLRGLLAGMSGNWGAPDLIGEPSLADGRAADRIRRDAMDLTDVLRRFHETVLAPAGIGTWRRGGEALAEGDVDGAVAAARMILGGRSLRACMALQHDWHRQRAVMDRAIPRLPGESDYAWPSLFEAFEHGGVTLRCLTSSAELRAEGGHGLDEAGMRGLSHCVGGYGSRCATGECHIVSLVGTGADGPRMRLSTMEIVFEGRIPQVKQHRGIHNGTPPEAAQLAGAELMHRIERGRIHLSPGALARRTPSPIPITDYDLRAAMAAWEPYLTVAGRAECAAILQARGAA